MPVQGLWVYGLRWSWRKVPTEREADLASRLEVHDGYHHERLRDSYINDVHVARGYLPKAY